MASRLNPMQLQTLTSKSRTLNKTKFLKQRRPGQVAFKDTSVVLTVVVYVMQAVDARNKDEERKKKEDGETGSFLKHQKTMKTFVYVYNTMLLVLGISKEDFTVFLNPYKPSIMVIGVRCNRVFYKFPGRSLL